jgi:hypothetical protein
MRLVGQAISMSIVTLLIALFVGQATLTEANPAHILTCMQVSFTLFTLLSVLGILASLKRGRLHNNDDKLEKT